jgi:hypothetical protein
LLRDKKNTAQDGATQIENPKIDDWKNITHRETKKYW